MATYNDFETFMREDENKKFWTEDITYLGSCPSFGKAFDNSFEELDTEGILDQKKTDVNYGYSPWHG